MSRAACSRQFGRFPLGPGVSTLPESAPDAGRGPGEPPARSAAFRGAAEAGSPSPAAGATAATPAAPVFASRASIASSLAPPPSVTRGFCSCSCSCSSIEGGAVLSSFRPPSVLLPSSFWPKKRGTSAPPLPAKSGSCAPLAGKGVTLSPFSAPERGTWCPPFWSRAGKR